MKGILVLHGANLNMLGKRDASRYGTDTLAEIDAQLADLAASLACSVESFQTNHEGEMIERIHRAHEEHIDAVVINPGAWTHYSYAIRDALEILEVPIIEVHMSNIHAREEFRRLSVIEPVAQEQIVGLGPESYLMGLRAAVALVSENR